jgi:hypothetical protein
MYDAYDVFGQVVPASANQEINTSAKRFRLGEQHLMRRIDRKFCTTWEGHIVKLSNGEILPHDEPLFLVRARDTLAVPLLNYYEMLSQRDGCIPWHMETLEQAYASFLEFKTHYPERMKQPSVTHGK